MLNWKYQGELTAFVRIAKEVIYIYHTFAKKVALHNSDHIVQTTSVVFQIVTTTFSVKENFVRDGTLKVAFKCLNSLCATDGTSQECQIEQRFHLLTLKDPVSKLAFCHYAQCLSLCARWTLCLPTLQHNSCWNIFWNHCCQDQALPEYLCVHFCQARSSAVSEVIHRSKE